MSRVADISLKYKIPIMGEV